ncbi:DNA-binding protein [Vibrio sp. D173a]|uniref:DNA-binding protein n=1 Tax=Vibrio sp. D173a TaxID=2836349 RepID=UPI002554CB1B|nr:DNA-binding protein [Vibrio sp. D173a]MDK9754902.1 DNA-binding protein [Vibrio sp. D173a]
MARERVFSDQQVIEAANALLVEGKNINGTSLRNKIGTGRPSALMSAFKALEDSGEILAPMLPDSTEKTITHQELPPEIAERLSVMLGDVEQLVHQINDHAHYTVEQRLNQAIAEANERAANAAKREAESIQEQDRAFELLEDVLEANTDLQELLKKEHKENSQLNAALNVAKNETKAALDTISERDERLADMQKQITTMQKQLNTAESDKAKAQGQVEQLVKQLGEKSVEMVELNANLKNSEKELGSLQGQTTSLTEQVVNQKAANNQLQDKYDEEKAEHIRTESRIESLNSELNKKNVALLETQASLGEVQKLSAKLEGQLMQYQQQ